MYSTALLTFNGAPSGSVPGSPYEGTYFKRSSDGGVTFGPERTVSHIGGNVYFLLTKNDVLLAYGQAHDGGILGVFTTRSTDGGVTWSTEQAVPPGQSATSLGYGDPAGAVDSNGNVYLVIRNDKYVDGSTITCGVTPCWTNSVVKSTDEGLTTAGWSRVETNRIYSRVDPANATNYSTWWNYGSPLTWTWRQWMSAGAPGAGVIFSDSNTGILLYNPSNP
jgi:hypothetical protein